MINRWYVLDLRPGASLVEALVGAGFDVWCLDWGVPEAEDRYLDWEAVLARLGRAVRRVQRETGAAKLGVLGYCMGGTLTAIYAAQHADEIAALVTLAARSTFSAAASCAAWSSRAGSTPTRSPMPATSSRSRCRPGFVALRPTLDLGKLVSMPDLATGSEGRATRSSPSTRGRATTFRSRPRPTAATSASSTRTTSSSNGTHRVAERGVDLGKITCPTLVITATRDQICPPAAATALLARRRDRQAVLEVAGRTRRCGRRESGGA